MRAIRQSLGNSLNWNKKAERIHHSQHTCEGKIDVQGKKKTTSVTFDEAKPQPNNVKETKTSHRNKKNLTKSNSSSSLYSVKDTIQMPDQHRILRSCARILTEMISQADTKNDADPFMCPSNCEDPTKDVVFEFLKEAYGIAEWSPECNIIALVLVNRLCGTASYQMSYRNWNKLTLISLLVAQKIWDDVPLTNVDFPQLWEMLFPDSQGFDIKQLNKMETKFLNMIEWQTHVQRSVYCHFFFELRALSMEENSKSEFPLNAMTDDQAQKLEMRSQSENLKALLTEEERKVALNRGCASEKIPLRALPGRSIARKVLS
jgi:hypothetical protein